MDDMYGGSVLSYGKVPCTPITGAFANYYDVFGDVEQTRVGRVGTRSSTASSTGSSGDCDESILEKDSGRIVSLVTDSFTCKSCKRSSKYKNKNDDSFNATSLIRRDPYIIFLQEKQVEVLGALHQEIRILKHENAELKFQIHVILRQQDVDSTLIDSCATEWLYQDKATPKTIDSGKSSARSVCGDREKILELELESATKMIQELKWLQHHYENKIRTQEIKLEDLVRQLNISANGSTENSKPLPMQLQSSTQGYKTTRSIIRLDRNLKSGRQRSLSVHQEHDSFNRRNSLQSILPEDYREKVATLPPISAKQFGNPGIPMRSPGSQFVPTSTAIKPHESMISNNNNNRRSLLMHSSTAPASLPRKNNAPAAFCEESNHYDG